MALLLGLSPLVIAVAMLLVYVGFALFQTAMVNAISQTLPPEEMGVGMGLFNLVGILSGAIGTAIVGRILGSGWADIRLLPFASAPAGFAYANIMLAFSGIVAFSGVAYLRGLRSPGRAALPLVALPMPSEVPSPSEQGCLETAGC